MLSPLLPSVDRWRSLTMQGQREEIQTFVKDAPVTSDSLRSLRIYIQQGFLEDVPNETFVPHGPEYAMQVWLEQLPRSRLLAPLRFTTINIMEEFFSDVHSQPIDILDFLSACPELEAFHYTGWHHNDDPPTEPLPVVSLPNLHTLHLKSTCMARSILSSLYTPRLTDLYLAHLNVELELRGEYHEEGDSEDDAQDFSQSPSSDHATGMGLRKLIARSHPPLVVLDMDFSDMRTKDFKYLFDRLPYLQEFLIVASDMSDTVIRLLRPFTLSGDDGTIHTRLPRLRRLGLYNCQRLSGDAIVEALSTRVQHTDNGPLGTNTLTDVAISACEGFTAEHGHILTERLGRRFRQS
ncbi:hypothetical protein LshimejAT787_0501310 [Lyophyllum shimeji]|uniref:F-box domain-containing protein n=1 Tax=Lyophyllum shimeji TaxID=47721 RepID=A0A9P3PMZ3_LYOSH|nr:hypothetical protein LshimejAT787_0501310 [Lyophyllum shimeji]